MFFIFRNTLHATRQRFPKEQKGFEAYNGSHMSNIPALIRCAISYVRLTELSPYVSFNSPSFHRIKDGAPRAWTVTRHQRVCGSRKEKKIYKYILIFHALKVCHSGNATNASPYVWQTIAYFDEKKRERLHSWSACLFTIVNEGTNYFYVIASLLRTMDKRQGTSSDCMLSLKEERTRYDHVWFP